MANETATQAPAKKPVTLTDILAKPENFGFMFLTETVKKDGHSTGPVPLIKITGVMKFEESFPGVILASEDGSSIRVKSQGIVREAWFSGTRDRKVLEQRLVESICLGVEPAQLKYGPGPNQEYFATPEEVTAAWQKFAQK